MRLRGFLDRLSKRAPEIVIATLCVALLGAWIGAPEWLANGLAILIGALALMVVATRRRRPQLRMIGDEESTESPSWLGYELAGKGTPLGTYLLAFFAFVTAMLTGFDTPFGKLAWAALALTIAWSAANAHFPVEPDPRPGDTIH